MVSPDPGGVGQVADDGVVELDEGLEEHGGHDVEDEAQVDHAVGDGLVKETGLEGEHEKDGGWKGSSYFY